MYTAGHAPQMDYYKNISVTWSSFLGFGALVWGSGLAAIFSRGNRGVCSAGSIGGCLRNLPGWALWCGYPYKTYVILVFLRHLVLYCIIPPVFTCPWFEATKFLLMRIAF